MSGILEPHDFWCGLVDLDADGRPYQSIRDAITARDRAVAAQALREAAHHLRIIAREVVGDADYWTAVEDDARHLQLRAAALDPEEPDHD